MSFISLHGSYFQKIDPTEDVIYVGKLNSALSVEQLDVLKQDIDTVMTRHNPKASFILLPREFEQINVFDEHEMNELGWFKKTDLKRRATD